MLEPLDISADRELRKLEVETFEIEDLAEIEQIGAATSTSTCSATTSCTSCSTAAMQPMPAHATR